MADPNDSAANFYVITFAVAMSWKAVDVWSRCVIDGDEAAVTVTPGPA
jgi:hypothetical protein